MKKIAWVSLAATAVVTGSVLIAIPNEQKGHNVPAKLTSDKSSIISTVPAESPAYQVSTPLTPKQSVVQQPVTTIAPTTTTGSTPTTGSSISAEDQNKANLQSLIFSTAASHGLTGMLLNAQWMCVEKIISYNLGWSDYNAAVNSGVAQVILRPWTSGNGTLGYRYYDGGGTCRIMSNPAN